MKGNKHSKNFLLQSAMEYLMTYGWAILILAIVLGALFQLGVFNASSYSPRAQPGLCKVQRVNIPGSTIASLAGTCNGQLPQYASLFTGTSYVRIPHSSLIDFNNVQSFSVQSWVKLTYNSNGFFLIKGGVDATPGVNVRGYTLRYHGGLFAAAIQDSTHSLWLWGTGVVPTISTWYQLVLVVDRAANLGKLYVNGVQIGSSTDISGVGSISSDWALMFGEWSPGNSYLPLNGMLSNVQIYNASLPASDVNKLYLEGMGGAPIDLAYLTGWWPLNGDTNDYSGNNNNGVPAGVSFTSQYGK